MHCCLTPELSVVLVRVVVLLRHGRCQRRQPVQPGGRDAVAVVARAGRGQRGRNRGRLPRRTEDGGGCSGGVSVVAGAELVVVAAVDVAYKYNNGGLCNNFDWRCPTPGRAAQFSKSLTSLWGSRGRREDKASVPGH